eukprot:GHUV01019340.1.p3 GENE.GHUV01019340.1~~GHUV01019340.1.p3  ORF type:complete len:101 (+),score=38.21 GHUV01019340.1:1380-1682(+)
MDAPNDSYQQPDVAATSDPAAFQGQEFTLLDISNRPSGSAAVGFPDNLTDGFGVSVSSVSVQEAATLDRDVALSLVWAALLNSDIAATYAFMPAYQARSS